MKLIDLNRAGGIGANSHFAQIGDFNFVVDCGLDPKGTGRLAAPDFGPVRGHNLNLVIITHCHLDHLGALAEQGVDVDRRKLQLDEGIRALGEYIVEVKLHPEVVAKLTVNVIKHGKAEQMTEAAPETDATEEAAAE